MISDFSFPTRIVFGPGAVARLPDLLGELGASRVLLVTDRGVAEAGLAQRVLDLLAGLFQAICFDGVEPNPTEACVEAAAEQIRSHGCDHVVALGGGSAIDAAKAACLRLNHPLPFNEYEARAEGYTKITAHVTPLVAIPTTAGTGSEVGRSTIITLEAQRRKAAIFSPRLLPSAALCDPELTLGLPPHITAATGMDALTHNIESYLSTVVHPICDSIALGGIRLVAGSLERAVRNGQDLEARADMMMAALMGGIAFQKDLGAAHALAHPLSTLAGVPHGLANAIALPHVLAYNRDPAASRLRDVAGALGCDISGRSDPGAADLAVEAVRDLLARIGLPSRLSEVGVTKAHIGPLAAQAAADPCCNTNPRPCNEVDLADLYRAAL